MSIRSIRPLVRRRPRLAALVLGATLGLGPLAACSHTPPQLSPQGRAAFTADQIVQRVNELENVAIQANANGALPTEATRRLLQFCVGADQTLKAVPAGWQRTVWEAWETAKRQLPPVTNPAVAAAMSAVDVVLASFGGN